MSRASEITLFLIILQASIGFVDSIGLFSEHYMDVPDNNASYVVSDLEDYAAQRDQDAIDVVWLMATWAWEAFFIAIKVIFTVAVVFPTLVNTFHIPVELSLFIQVGIYYVYAIWYAQFKSGKGWMQYE